jgi:hypothetical protein
MPETVVALLSVMVFLGATVVLPFALVRWRLRRRNRVHPRIASPAPLRWLVAPSAPARLHRRLQTTVRVASTHTGRLVPAEIAEHAVELDRRVVLASRQPFSGRGATLRELAAEADELDRLALAVTRPLDRLAVGDAHERLSALASARAEVEEIDGRYAL